MSSNSTLCYINALHQMTAYSINDNRKYIIIMIVLPICIFAAIISTFVIIMKKKLNFIKAKIKSENVVPTVELDKSKEVRVKNMEPATTDPQPQKGFFVGNKMISTLQFYQKTYNYDKQYQLMYICFALSLFYSFSSFIVWWPSIAITLGIDIMGVGALAMLVSCIDPNGDCYGINQNCVKILFHTIFFTVISCLQLLWGIGEVVILAVITGFIVGFKEQLDNVVSGVKLNDSCVTQAELMDLMTRMFPGASVSAQLAYTSYSLLTLIMFATSTALIITKIVLSIKVTYGKLMLYFEHNLVIHK